MTDDDATYSADGPGDDGRGRVRSKRAAARRRLLEAESGNVHDLDTAADCECSCHPRPGQPDRHSDQICHCQWTDQDRRDHLAEFNRVTEQHRSVVDDLQGENARALAEAAAELSMEATEEVTAAPWVLVGLVDGRRFYLRERWTPAR